jgi:nitroimidazol reductase NimA-like FMN-containing flavoprotein (pyridoxamine 5'-phosphate oxidase superfamily)
LDDIRFTEQDLEFLAKNEACRVATCRNAIPHVVPVSYVFERDAFYFAADYGTKKLENLKANPNLALTVDIYSSIGNKAVCIQGRTSMIESGPEFERLYQLFFDKFSWVRANPWKAGEAPFVKVSPYTKVSWGLG